MCIVHLLTHILSNALRGSWKKAAHLGWTHTQWVLKLAGTKSQQAMMIVILKILKKETNETASRSVISVNGSAMMILILK